MTAHYLACAGEAGEIHIPHAAWLALLDLAGRYGWDPSGTVRPGKWCGGYDRPCGQMLTASDAHGLAAALDEALADIPDHEARPLRNDRPPQLLELFSGRRRVELFAVARFLEAGSCVLGPLCPQHASSERTLLN